MKVKLDQNEQIELRRTIYANKMPNKKHNNKQRIWVNGMKRIKRQIKDCEIRIEAEYLTKPQIV